MTTTEGGQVKNFFGKLILYMAFYIKTGQQKLISDKGGNFCTHLRHHLLKLVTSRWWILYLKSAGSIFSWYRNSSWFWECSPHFTWNTFNEAPIAKGAPIGEMPSDTTLFAPNCICKAQKFNFSWVRTTETVQIKNYYVVYDVPFFFLLGHVNVVTASEFSVI